MERLRMPIHTTGIYKTFQAGVNYVNYNNFEGYDENGQATSGFTGSEIALSFGYAYNIPNTDIHIDKCQINFINFRVIIH
jgi:hypothetical protein